MTRKQWYLIGGSALVGIFLGFLGGALSGLPSFDDLKAERPNLSTTLLDDTGQPFSQLFVEQRNWVTIAHIPKLLQDTFIAVEDERFYSHWGVDPKAILRAILKNLLHIRVVEGASTITQQLARDLFLTQKKYFVRKIQEAITAIRLEHQYTKREIMEFYLNRIYFGSGAYGVEAASRTYFAKSVQSLTPGEIALLAGLPRSPNRYSPFKNLPLATKRRNLILERMGKQGLITIAQAQAEKAAPLKAARAENKDAPYFVEMVRQQLEESIGSNLIYRGGLEISTTLNLTLQTIAQLALNRALQEGDARADEFFGKVKAATRPRLQGAVMAINPHTGHIKALIGGREFRESEFNRALQAKRQPGSAFKPMIYGAAIDAGFTPATLLADMPVEFEDSAGRKWKPQNYERTFYGMNTLRNALIHSRNVSTVRLLMKVGPDAVIQYARKMGIQSDLRREMSLALGVSEMTLAELVRAYGVFASGGIRSTPFGILQVKDSFGHPLEDHGPRMEEVLAPAPAYLMTHLLSGVVDHGTAYGIRQAGLKIPAAGKTGTTDENSDVWFIGYTPDLVLGIWIGYDDRMSMGKWASSAALAVPIWAEIMGQYYAGRPVDPFGAPPNIERASIDPATGQLATPRCPKSLEEVFIEGTAPKQKCEKHGKEAFIEFR